MKKNNIILKSIFTYLLLWCLFSVSFANTAQKWRDIINTLREDERPDDEIRPAITDLWYNANEYLWKNNSNINVIYSNNSNNASKTTSQWRKIINQYRKDWRTDEEIKQALEEAWLDYSGYFPENNETSNYTNNFNTDEYTSRSCKTYTIEYIQSLNAYTSSDFLKKEYFINVDYMKRYIDSKNARSTECYINWWWISTSYVDTYNWTDRYIAPNWKIYFIKQENWLYTSNELNSRINFQTSDELKNYIKERNPLISMWISDHKNQDPITELWNELLN